MLGKHSSVETTVCSAQQLLLDTSLAIIIILQFCHCVQIVTYGKWKKQPCYLSGIPVIFRCLINARWCWNASSTLYSLSPIDMIREVLMFLCDLAVQLWWYFLHGCPWLAFNWPTTVKWHNSTKNTFIIQNSISTSTPFLIYFTYFSYLSCLIWVFHLHSFLSLC